MRGLADVAADYALLPLVPRGCLQRLARRIVGAGHGGAGAQPGEPPRGEPARDYMYTDIAAELAS